MLYQIIVGPIEYFLKLIFAVCHSITFDDILSLVGLSLTINFLTLPLYNRADLYQTMEREKQRKMEQGIKKIKRAFRGDERFWILSAYYKEQDYKSVYVFRSALSVLLQIPFFLAAYNYLSSVSWESAWLGSADQWLTIGNIHMNVLPILMTMVNLLSGIVYSKELKWKEKWQIFALPLLFLIILYNSPSGLVIYWIFNNLFSLFKNIVVRMRLTKIAQKICAILAYIVGMVVFMSVVYVGCYSADLETDPQLNCIVVVGLFLLSNVPIIVWLYIKEHKISAFPDATEHTEPSIYNLFWKELYLFVFGGVFIATNVIAASPMEFIQTSMAEMLEMLSCLLLCTGGFLFVWMTIFYYLVPRTQRLIFSEIMSFIIFLVSYNYFFWGNHYGLLRVDLHYEDGVHYAWTEALGSLLCLWIVTGIFFFLYRKLYPYLRKRGTNIVLLMTVGLVFVVIQQSVAIGRTLAFSKAGAIQVDADDAIFRLSKDKENVVIIMLDRAIGAYVPYIMEERPELLQQFDGFTLYTNAISLGKFTNLGAPELFGGYEYTPTAMNARADESLRDKHNEALKVLPVLFEENDFHVIVADLPYANYQWVSDMSIFNVYEDVQAYNLEYSIAIKKSFTLKDREAQGDAFRDYSVFRCMPLFLHRFVYDQVLNGDDGPDMTGKTAFAAAYTSLDTMVYNTEIVQDEQGYFIAYNNNMTHEPRILQLPDYTFDELEDVDNSGYREPDTYILANGQEMKMQSEAQRAHYHVNIAALLKLGEWLQFIQDNGAYDNTRIIIVSDHGRALGQFENMLINEEVDAEAFNCLLMYKDFHAHGFHVSTDYMTNADVPTMAVQNIIPNAQNPFTGKLITMADKADVRVTLSEKFEVSDRNVFDTSDAPWYHVQGDIFKRENWVKVTE